MSELIHFENVSKQYRTGDKVFVALDKINLTVEKGEFVVILGPSGAGKSTLLNLLGGMDSADEGKVFVADREITSLSSKQMTQYRAEDVGFIFQFYNILPTLTVKENVALVNDIVKKPKDAMEVLNSVGLAEHADKFPGQLSGGEQQRVSIARAIAKNPILLLCDEPTGALDSVTGVEVLKLLKEQCRVENGEKTIVIVTHNALISEIADRVIRLKNGKVVSNTVNENPKNIDEVVW